MPVLTPSASDELNELLSDPLRKIVAHLAKNAIPGDLPSLDLSTLQECDFPAYAPQVNLQWAIDPDSADDTASARSQALEFVAGNIVVPQLATLVYLTINFANGDVGLWRYFPIPDGFLFEKAGDTYTYAATILNVQAE